MCNKTAPPRLRPWVIGLHFATLFALFLTQASAADTQANLIISNESVLFWSTAQIKFFVAQPILLTTGRISLDFPPGFLASEPVGVSVFSAKGDGYGYAMPSKDRSHWDIQFASPSGGIGQLPGVPIVTLTVSVANGNTAAIQATAAAWKDVQGRDVNVTVTPGSITLQGAISISQVAPVTSQAAEQSISINGSGFTSTTQLEIEGVVVSSIEIADTQTIHARLKGPVDLTGKRVRLNDSARHSSVDFYPSLNPEPLDSLSPGFLPILPLQANLAAITSGITPRSQGGIFVTNPNDTAVDVLLQGTMVSIGVQRTFTVPPAGSVFVSYAALAVGSLYQVRVIASAPVRTLQLTEAFQLPPADPGPTISVHLLDAINVPPTLLTIATADPSVGTGFGALEFTWQVGAPAPKSQPLTAYPGVVGDFGDFRVSTSGEPWLQVSPDRGSTCGQSNCPSIAVSVNPISLKPGIYRATVTITPTVTAEGRQAIPSIVPVALTITEAAIPRTQFGQATLDVNFRSTKYQFPVGFFTGPVSLTVSTGDGGKWLSAIAAADSTTVTADPTGLKSGVYSGTVLVTGNGNTEVVQVMFSVYGETILQTGSVRFGVFENAGSPAPVVLTVGAYCYPIPKATPDCPGGLDVIGPLAVSAQTRSGGDWLTAVVSGTSILVSANVQGLKQGTYLGFITVTSPREATLSVPVALLIHESTVPALSAGPGAIYFSGFMPGPRQIPIPSACVTSAGVPVSITTTIESDGNWLQSAYGFADTTPICVSVGAPASSLPPGTYTGRIIFSGPGQIVTVPVTYTVAGPAGKPYLAFLTNAASSRPGPVSPGEIITLHGTGLGPIPGAGAEVSPAGVFPTNLGGASIQFGKTAVPLIYASATQLNAIVPYEVDGQPDVPVQININGSPAVAFTVPVRPTAPALFTANSSGVGPGAVLNQDNSLNSESNPAAPGSVIQIFLTGTGQTMPAAKTGGVAMGPDRALASISVRIGSLPAQVVYAGSAPKAVYGLTQVNAIVPSSIASGSGVPVVVTAGDVQCQSGVTIAVR